MIRGVLSLIRTLVDIILLRKGPEALPRSQFLLTVAIALWLLSSVAALIFDEYYSANTFLLVLLAATLGVAIYALLVNAAGHYPRLLQTLTAIIGCGAVLTFVALICESWLPYAVSEQQVQGMMNLIILWSVAVEGHIIARAINRHWFVGFVVAFTVFIVQLFMLASLAPTLDPRPERSAEQVISPTT